MNAWWRFDFYYSLPFWAALALAAATLRLVGRGPRPRGLVLLALSSAFLLALPQFGPGHLAVVWAVAAATYGAAWALCHPGLTDERQRQGVAVAGVALVLGCLALVKYRFLQELLPLGRATDAPGVPAHLSLLGASYFSFKAIHVIVEARKRTFARVDPLDYLNYLTFFPSFISGPIGRFGPFAEQLKTASGAPLGQDLRRGGERIVHGLFKKFVLVPIVFPHILAPGAQPGGATGGAEVALGLCAYALYFYFDFAGYTDLAIGAARILGFELPENFDRPFLQRNIRELWSNWHMSLTSWLVDYVYWPLVRRLRSLEYFRSRPVLLSIVGMNVTFVACGMWHGESLHFVLWGAYHGLGISALNLYQRQKRRIRSAAVQRYFQSTASRVLGAVATFHFFALGLLLFVLDLEQLRALWRALAW